MKKMSQFHSKSKIKGIYIIIEALLLLGLISKAVEACLSVADGLWRLAIISIVSAKRNLKGY